MTTLRQRCDYRLEAMRGARTGYYTHWRQLADFILPRRYRWLLSANELYRGATMNNMIIDSTATIAARTLASGMMSGITSPSRPWFKLRLDSAGTEENSPINRWLAVCEKRMLRVFAESNFYNAMAQMYLDLAIFGTAPVLLREDYEDVIRCHNPCAGEYFLENSYRGDVDTLYREFTMTLRQMADEFGEEKLTDSQREMLKRGTHVNERYVICCAIEPHDGGEGISDNFKWRELYWDKQSGQDHPFLRKRGFHEKPFIAPRWDIVGEDAYGSSPGMDALGDIKQLQQEQKRKAQAIDKMTSPPMLADITLKNQPASLLPGGLTYVANLGGSAHAGMRPVYQVNPPVQELMLDIQQVQQRIKDIFFNNLFMMISQLQSVRTATEIDARRAEQLIQLGPVLERLQNEALDPVIDRVFGVMWRGGLLPDPPGDVAGEPLKVEYVSMLAEAQAAVATSGIERMLAQAGSIAAIDPTVLDVFDFKDIMQEYAYLLRVDPKLVRNDVEVAAIRQKREEDVEKERAAAMSMAAVQGAKTLSETDVGGGRNALAAMLGNA